MKFSVVVALASLAVAQSCPALPTTISYQNQKLPDPFAFADGSRRAASMADWTCRAAELSTLFQRYELGTLPSKPARVTGSFSSTNNTLTVSVTTGAGTSISFDARISYPESGLGGDAFPAIIALGGLNIPPPTYAAVITFNNDEIARQGGPGSRGKGKFYTLYGANHSAGALMAWTWGVSRIIDALESTPNAKIDTTHIGVTGCAGNGKGAFVAGAFDKRIALTVPQESGAGGSACWRLSDAMRATGKNVQTASGILNENVWLSPAFTQYASNTTKLPIDHHELAALVAPRGLYVIENTSIEWLGNESTNGCMRAGAKVYDALGQPANVGFQQVGGHAQCALAEAQQSGFDAFVAKFLYGWGADTWIRQTDGNFTFDETRWVDWTTPVLYQS
ncbi:carbohydrate esterase family 15 protein [Exidia glandulosa HHB12029]|uniref:(4-O-methyl)-D-glucuronate--lignin esterase n=1 Tax=Exidia glandulosa HHB12029 TaxID=1314781 RepID=A0A165PNX1_EXIGL|nr:carbohydrate esterase family 15 protein [Exidia glandulosa HHB12029]